MFGGGQLLTSSSGSLLTPELFGCSKVTIDELCYTNSIYVGESISHSLGEAPKYVFCIPTGLITDTSCLVFGLIYKQDDATSSPWRSMAAYRRNEAGDTSYYNYSFDATTVNESSL